MEYSDTAHRLNEFANFPWHRMNDEWFERQGGLSLGGITAGVDFNPRKPSICFYDEHANCDRWEVPEQLYRLLETYRNRGNREARQKIRDAIGYQD